LCEKKIGTRINKAIVGFSGMGLSSAYGVGGAIISRADNTVGEADISTALSDGESHINIENRKIIHRIPIEFYLDGKPVLGSPIGLKGIKLEVKILFVTAMTQHLEMILSVISRAGIEVIDIIASPLATASAILTEKQKSVGVGVIDIGAETVSAAIYENGVPISVFVLPIGSNDITKDIALGLKVDFDEAEQIKIGAMQPNVARRKLEDIIFARVIDFFEYTDSQLKKIKRSGLLPAGVILVGRGSLINGIEAFAKEVLRLPSKTFTAETGPLAELPDSSWYTAYGLMHNGLQVENELVSEDSSGDSAVHSLKKAWKNILGQLLP
jgi:cell division protein FtsA